MEIIKEITDIELAEMFNISLDKLKQEIKDGTFVSYAKNNNTYILPKKKDSPIKVITDDTFIECNDDFDFEVTRKLSPFEAEILLKDIFGTTEVGIFNCNDMLEEEFNDIIDKFNSIPEGYPILADDLHILLEEKTNGSN